MVRGDNQPEISQQELDIARNKVTSSMILSAERPGNRLFTIGNAVTLRGVYETLEQSLAKYQAVDLPSVHAALADFKKQPSALVTVGP
jgi:predicted Zn-dependent peptidase